MSGKHKATPAKISKQVLISYNNTEKESTGGLDLFATFDPEKCGKKIQQVAKRSNTWQKDPMPGKKSFRAYKTNWIL